MAVVVIVCGYVCQQGQELRKVNLPVFILVLFLKDIGQVISAPFLLWEKHKTRQIHPHKSNELGEEEEAEIEK